MTIQTLKLRIGPSHESEPLSVELSPVTVFVGPNNAGKSMALREIFRFCQSGEEDSHDQVVRSLTMLPIPWEKMNGRTEAIIRRDAEADPPVPAWKIIGSRVGEGLASLPELEAWLADPHSNLPGFCQNYLRHFTVLLKGTERFALVAPQPIGDLLRQPETSFQALFQDDRQREEVRRVVHEAIGDYFVLDPTNVGSLRIGLAKRPPTNPSEERGLAAEAIEFHRGTLSIADAGDGIKAFVGVVVEMQAGDPRVLLIDEPEAFLHPSLCSRLGFELARSAQSYDKQVVATTHSPFFLMGCIQSGVPITIIRLTYDGQVGTARALPSARLLELMRKPVLRSTGVLSGVFHSSVVVCEGDADRVFYQEVNTRILEQQPDLGLANSLFLSAQGKQAVSAIIGPLRELGVPAAGIVDVDVINLLDTEWSSLLSSIGVPDRLIPEVDSLRTAIVGGARRGSSCWKNVICSLKKNDLKTLESDQIDAISRLRSVLASYGLFIVPVGELEHWLHDLDLAKSNDKWVVKMLGRLGDDPADAKYVHPADGDVWEFIRVISRWVRDPNRKGIPV